MKIDMRIMHWYATDDDSEKQRQSFRKIYAAYLSALAKYTDFDESFEAIMDQVVWECTWHGHKSYLVMLDNKPIGLVILGSWPNAFSRHDTYIQEFFILPEYQRNGYGTQVVEWIVNSGPVDDDISLYILPKNEPAKTFWTTALGGLDYRDRFEDASIDAKTKEGLIFRHYIKR